MTRRAAIGLATLAILISLAARMILGSTRSLKNAAVAAERTNHRETLRQLRHAMAYYFPGNPWVREAARRLRQRALHAERDAMPDLALDAWRSLRSSILALRGLGSPYGEYLDEINRHIANLNSTHPQAAAHIQDRRGHEKLLKRLSSPKSTQPFWTAIALAGFLLWVFSAFRLLFFAPAASTQPDARRQAALFISGLIFFCFGLALA